MKWCVETEDNLVVEVTHMFDVDGNETADPLAAEAVTLRFTQDLAGSAPVCPGDVHWIH